MARGSISLRGVPQLKKILAAIKPLVKKEARNACYAGAAAVSARARRAAPEKSGVLKSDIRTTMHKTKPIAYSGVPRDSESAPYVAPTEFGTSEVDAQPFLFPALEQEREQHIARLGRVLRAGLEKL